MSKLSLKVFVYTYVFIKMSLGLIAPFATGYIAYKIVNPNNFLWVIIFIVVWIVLSFITIIIAKYLYEEIRYRFKRMDNLIYEIEDYIKYKQ